MATIIGRNATVEISSDNISYTAIGKVTQASLDLSHDTADETNNDSAGYKEQKYASGQAKLDVQCKYNSADTGQAAVLSAKASAVTRYFRFRPQAAGGEFQYVFQGTIDDVSVSTETEAVEDLSFSVSSTGTITKSAQ